MIDFILQNKEWLFSGVGISVVLGIIAISKKMLHGKRDKDRTNEVVIHLSASREMINSTDQKNVISIERLRTISFKEIENAIKTAPPLQRDEVKKNFTGIKVGWDTYLKGASKEDESIVSLRLSPGPDPLDSLYTISCRVSLQDYRELGILPEGSRIRIHGEIASADRFDIELINVKLFFLDGELS